VSLLEVSDLHVWFDLPGDREVHAVRGVSFALEPGEALGLVGESGCGKSSVVLAMLGLLPRTASVAGEVRLDGVDLLGLDEEGLRAHRWLDVAMVFQGAMNALNPVLTVGAQLDEARRRRPDADGPAAAELLALVGIAPGRADAYPHELSGGMRQRVALAMALACRPRVLLTDEPTTGLDVMVQAQILQLLDRLRGELGLAVVFVSHDLPVVGRLCERGAVMYAGRFVETGTLPELYHRPAHPYTRLLFAATPDIASDRPLVAIPGAPPRLDVPLRGCPFRPRCPHASARCEEHEPALDTVAPGHLAACHLLRSAG